MRRARGPEWIVNVDLDGVLADPDGVVTAKMRRRHPTVEPVAGRPHFHVARDYPEQYQQEAFDIMTTPGFFLDLPLIRGAIAGLHQILDQGHHPRICSSPIPSIRTRCTAEKLGWVEHVLVPEFGPWIAEQAIITSDKFEAGGAVLLDDRDAIRNSDSATWQHAVFVDTDKTYNHASEAPHRLEGWQDPNLSAILEACRTGYDERLQALGHASLL